MPGVPCVSAKRDGRAKERESEGELAIRHPQCDLDVGYWTVGAPHPKALMPIVLRSHPSRQAGHCQPVLPTVPVATQWPKRNQSYPGGNQFTAQYSTEDLVERLERAGKARQRPSARPGPLGSLLKASVLPTNPSLPTRPVVLPSPNTTTVNVVTVFLPSIENS